MMPALARMNGPPETPPMRVPLTANRRNHANVARSLKAAGSPPAKTRRTIKLLHVADLRQQGTAAPQEAVTLVWCGRDVHPTIQFATCKEIGGAQRLNRAGVGHQREVGNKKQTDDLRALLHGSNLTENGSSRQDTGCAIRKHEMQAIRGRRGLTRCDRRARELALLQSGLRMRYSLLTLLKNTLSGHQNWTPAWREPEPKKATMLSSSAAVMDWPPPITSQRSTASPT